METGEQPSAPEAAKASKRSQTSQQPRCQRSEFLFVCLANVGAEPRGSATPYHGTKKPRRLQRKLGRMFFVAHNVDLVFGAPVPQCLLCGFGLECIPFIQTGLRCQEFFEPRIGAAMPKVKDLSALAAAL